MIPAFSASRISPEAEEIIGRLMLKQARDEGHCPRSFGRYISSVKGLCSEAIVDAILEGKTRVEIADEFGVTYGALDGFMRRNDLSTKFLLAEKRRREDAA